MSEKFDHGYAVVIGVDDNKIKRLALPGVANDVSALYDVLVHPERCAFDPQNVQLLKGEDSTRANILKAFMWLEGKVKADGNATAVIYYSGHGMRDKATERYYLIPYDIESLGSVKIDALKAEDVQSAISDIQAKRTLVLLDCCHAEGMEIKDLDLAELEGPNLDYAPFPELAEVKDVPVYESDDNAKAVSDLAEGEGRAILNSSTGAESSYVSGKRNMSYFTYYLLEALTGHAPHDDEDTVVLVTDVMSWVARKVKKAVQTEVNKSQTPIMRTNGVFPIAQLIGGKGVALSKGELAPDPLAPLPEVGSRTTTIGQGDYAEGDIHKREGGIHVDGQAEFHAPVIEGGLGGDLVMGNKTEHQEIVHGDKVGGDKIGGDKITVGGIAGGVVAIGAGAQAVGQMQGGGPPAEVDLARLFAPLYTALATEAPQQMSKAIALKAELDRGTAAEDDVIAGAILDISAAAPGAKMALAGIFKDAKVASIVQGMGATKFAIGRL